MIQPGEKLMIAASKTRPAMEHISVNVPNIPANIASGIGYLLSSSFYNSNPDPLGHDVQFNTGTINMTFYGSYVSADREYIP